MDALSKELINLHGKEGLRADQWFDLMIDDVLAGFGILLTEIPSDAVREVLFDLSGLYAQEAMKAAPFADLLGAVHMELVSQYHQKGTGQFFTPSSVSKMLAKMVVGDIQIRKDRLTTICDPTVGAGGMLLSAADIILENHGTDALAWISFTGVDIDHRCARMYPCQFLTSLYINQLSLGELVSYQGNTLGDPTEWRTVCQYSRRDLPEMPSPADHPEVKKAVATAITSHASPEEQLTLF